jgi:hypothetical protein
MLSLCFELLSHLHKRAVRLRKGKGSCKNTQASQERPKLIKKTALVILGNGLPEPQQRDLMLLVKKKF